MKEVSVSFRISGEELDPEIITRNLNLKSHNSHKKGDPNISKTGRRYSDYSEGLWSINSDLSNSENIENHIKSILDKIVDSKKYFQSLKQKGFRMNLFVGVFNEDNMGFFINHELLKEIGEMGIDLDFDIYSME